MKATEDVRTDTDAVRLDRRERVLFVSPRYGWFKRSYYESLAGRFDAKLVAAMHDRVGDPIPQALREQLDAVSLGNPGVRVGHYSLAGLVRLWRMVWDASKGADLVVASTQAPVHSKVAFLVATMRRIPFAVVIQQWRERPKEGLLRDVYNRFSIVLMRRAVACLAHGEKSRDYCVRMGVRQDRAYVYPYTSADLAELNSFDPYAVRADGPCRILYAGRFVEVKGVGVLLEAAREALSRGADLQMNLAGEGPLLDECMSRVEDLKKTISFLGQLSPQALVRAMCDCDVLVLPSIMTKTMNEGWGLVVSEAASLGKVLIVTDAVGCGPEFVRDGENGYVVPHSQVVPLTEAIVRVTMMSGEERRAMGDRSRRLFEEYNDPNVCVRILERILERNS